MGTTKTTFASFTSKTFGRVDVEMVGYDRYKVTSGPRTGELVELIAAVDEIINLDDGGTYHHKLPAMVRFNGYLAGFGSIDPFGEDAVLHE